VFPPRSVARYICGNEKVIDVKNKSRDEIKEVTDVLRRQSGRKKKRLDKPVYTQSPSLQGYWRPDIQYATAFLRDEARP